MKVKFIYEEIDKVSEKNIILFSSVFWHIFYPTILCLFIYNRYFKNKDHDEIKRDVPKQIKKDFIYLIKNIKN